MIYKLAMFLFVMSNGLNLLMANEEKSWVRFIEYHSTIPKLYDLPKTHKLGTPMYLIVLGINSTPQK